MEQQDGRSGRLATFAGQLGGKLGVAVCIIGFVVIFLGWNGAASFNDLRQQFPYVISGGIAGLAMVALGAALLVIEAARAERAELQSSIEDLRRAIEGLGSVSSNGTTAAAPAATSDLVVAGSASYHRPDCRLVAGREQSVLVTLDEAEEQGLAACRICTPSAPTPGRLRAR
ncbi:MAG TPA: hypothetical protein VFU93_05000 [Acidimicrobiales bacterium]|nr:hypothetical protein [Acidimicrobiales bacterium]